MLKELPLCLDIPNVCFFSTTALHKKCLLAFESILPADVLSLLHKNAISGPSSLEVPHRCLWPWAGKAKARRLD